MAPSCSVAEGLDVLWQRFSALLEMSLFLSGGGGDDGAQ